MQMRFVILSLLNEYEDDGGDWNTLTMAAIIVPTTCGSVE